MLISLNTLEDTNDSVGIAGFLFVGARSPSHRWRSVVMGVYSRPLLQSMLHVSLIFSADKLKCCLILR